MPVSSNSPGAYQWSDSWPPAQLHLHQPGHKNNNGHGPDMSLAAAAAADDNPLAYFLDPLTPPLLVADDDDGDVDDYSYGYGFGYSAGMDFDLDAGIEDDAHPQPDIRSVSPSALAENILTGGVSGRPSSAMRPPTPPKTHLDDNGDNDDDDDDDDEDYIRYGDDDHHFETFGYTFGQTVPIRIANTNNNRRGKTVTRKGKVSSMRSSHHLSGLSSLPSLPSLSLSPPPSSAAMIPRRRSPRSWRVPSPDVFMIEEEPETEDAEAATSRPKHVRFVLPHDVV